MRVRLAILAGAALLVAGQPLAAQPRPDVRQYVEFALGQLKARHINSARADWTTIELEAESLLVHARDTRDARKVIDHVLRRLGEKHSFIFHPEEAAEHRKNAAEQGALSNKDGRAGISWFVDPADGLIPLVWTERGGRRRCLRRDGGSDPAGGSLDRRAFRRHVSPWS